MDKVLIELLKVGKERKGIRGWTFNALQDLNNEYGFDFCEPLKAVKFHASFTVNSLKRDFGIDTDKQVVAVIFDTTHWLYCARLDGERVVLSKGNPFDTLDSVYTKTDFNDYRKGGVLDVYVIAQHKEFTKEPKGRYNKRDVDLNTRYSYYREEKREGLIERGERKIYENKIGGWYDLDKSGYVLDLRRDDLLSRARKIRIARNKEKYLQMTNTQDMIAKARKAIETKKIELSTLLLDCNTSEEIEKIIDKLSYWDGLKGCYRNIESIEKREREKSFTSPKHFYDNIAEIYEVLNEI